VSAAVQGDGGAGGPEEGGAAARAAAIIARLTESGTTLAAAESLTGGLLTGALTSVPGASLVVRGGIVAYATQVKADLLGVDAALLERVGPVSPGVAAAMAQGARRRLGATWGISTTGEAGPESGSGQPVGTVHLAVSGPRGDQVASVRIEGDRAQVRAAAVAAALDLLANAIE
jgi:nicotinamide-nucleotide amidase